MSHTSIECTLSISYTPYYVCVSCEHYSRISYSNYKVLDSTVEGTFFNFFFLLKTTKYEFSRLKKEEKNNVIRIEILNIPKWINESKPKRKTLIYKNI